MSKYELKELSDVTEEERNEIYEYAIKRSEEIVSNIEHTDKTHFGYRKHKKINSNKDTIICPACGSKNLKDEVTIRYYTHSSGEIIYYALVIQRCGDCHEAGDWKGENPKIVNLIIEEINKRIKEYE